MNTMTTPPNTDVQPSEQQTAIDILTEMAEKYRQAEEYFNDVRDGLVEAARDARIHGVKPVDIGRITGWSRTTVHANTQQVATSDRPNTSVKPPNTRVRRTESPVQTSDTGVQPADTTVRTAGPGVRAAEQDVQSTDT
jgi:hypothetical protein